MSGGKGGTKTSAQEIPKWLEDAVIQNLNQAKSAAEIGYVPYYGQDVAALSPMEQSAMQGTMGAMSAFGMAPKGAQYQSSLPEPSVVNGMRGYRSGDLYDAALQELNVRAPDQAKRYSDFYKNLSDTPMISNAPANPYAGMPGAQNMSYGGGGGQQDPGGNYWAQREAEVGKARAFAEQSAQNQKINDGLTSFGKMGFGGILGAITGGTPGDARAPVSNMSTYSADSVTDTGFGTDPSQGGYWG
jgi:hypothetical protein